MASKMMLSSESGPLEGTRASNSAGSAIRETGASGGRSPMVALMPQGTIPRGRAFFDPELKGRWGAARLAEGSRAPVIPIGIWGTENVWPRSAKFPNLNPLGKSPVVTIRVGKPVELKYDSLEADTERIMHAIVALLPPEARQTYEPSEEEIRRALPAGVEDVDPGHEKSRRPGSD